MRSLKKGEKSSYYDFLTVIIVPYREFGLLDISAAHSDLLLESITSLIKEIPVRAISCQNIQQPVKSKNELAG